MNTAFSYSSRTRSRLLLGTAQWGLSYGVANRTGKPGYRQVRSMVKVAFEQGVNAFDTAAAYGDSEVVLGRALRELGVTESAFVATKICPLKEEVRACPKRAREVIEQSVADSRERLRLDCLPLVLFHREADARYLSVLEALKQRGWISRVGVSCGPLTEPKSFWSDYGGIHAVQLPTSLLDPRYIRRGIFKEAAERNVAVFVRSLFLQGLLVMPEKDIPAALSRVTPVRRSLEAVAAESGQSLAELAVRYMLAQDGVTALVIGVETPEQIQRNIRFVEQGPLEESLVTRLNNLVPHLPEAILNPALWPRDT